jgi:hypothetical protein
MDAYNQDICIRRFNNDPTFDSTFTERFVFKVLKDSPENFRDLSILADCDTDKSIDAARKLVCRLYDQKEKLKEDHVDLNKLRVRLVTLRDACLAKLPPCEATFTQYVLRSSLQINIGMTAYVAQPPMKSAVLFGWEDRNGLVPVYLVSLTLPSIC